jgi:ribose transport system substrate-binding protein
LKSRAVRSTAIIGIAALSLIACNRGGGDASGGSERTVGFAMSTLNNPFFVSMRDGAQEAADDAGIKLVFTDARDDPAQQANQVSDFTSQNVDGVILNAVDSDAAGAIVSPLNSSGTPVVAVDRAVIGADVSTFIASDNVAGGRLAADALAEAIGETGEIIILQGVPGTSASRDRGAGFEEAIAAYPNVQVVAKQPADFDRTQGLNVATNLLQAHPNAVGIFAENDEMALGAIQALGARAGSDVKVVGFDATPDGLAAIESGTMNATVAQKPAELGRASVEAMVSALDGDDVEPEIMLPVEVVTSKNLADFK